MESSAEEREREREKGENAGLSPSLPTLVPLCFSTAYFS